MDYLENGHTIIGAYYAALLRQRQEKIKKVLFYQDNAPIHTSTVAMAAIQKCGFQLVEDPPYSSDLDPSVYYLLPKWKKELGGHKFARDDDIMNAVDHFLRDQNGAVFTEGSVCI